LIGKKFFIVVFSIGLLGFIGCSSTKINSNENARVLFSKKYYSSDNSNLSIKIPLGWHGINDNNKKLFDVWLVSPDKNSSIVFLPLTLEINNEFKSIEDSLNFFYRLMKMQKEKKNDNFELVSETETIAKKNIFMKEYRFKINGNEKQSIIFGKNNIFYECLAFYNDTYTPTRKELDNLFYIQSSIITETKIKKNKMINF